MPLHGLLQHALLPVTLQRAGGGGRGRARGAPPQQVPQRGAEGRRHSGVSAAEVLREQTGREETQVA